MVWKLSFLDSKQLEGTYISSRYFSFTFSPPRLVDIISAIGFICSRVVG
jgi:hypothetical protein